MANTDKNIVITPNIGSSNDPQIVFTGASATVGPQTITIRAYPTNNGTLSFEGSSGQLFSISNNLTGTVFSVNDVSGIPSIEVLDTGVVKLAQYGGNILLGTGTDDGAKLHIEGGVSMTGGWRRTLTLTSVYPGLVFNSNNSRWASINYDYSSNFVIRVGATSSDTFGTGVSALSIGATSGTVSANGGTLLSQGNVNYSTWDTWLRENGDDANVKLYGNSRQMVFRTDGTTEYASGVGGYAFAWMYGGDSASERRMLLGSDGRLWTNYHGWLDSAFAAASHSHAYLSDTAATFTGDSVDRDNITTRVDSGFYQSSTGTLAEGWPLDSGGWQHMLACTHANDSNYYSMQLAADFFSQDLYYRSTNNSGSTGWSKVWTSSSDGTGSGLDADLLDGNHASAFAVSGHNHTYDVNDAWLRENGDNAHVKLYGNSRQMVFRTDGTAEYSSGVGAFPFVWMYNGDAAANRLMIMSATGRLWLNPVGWIDEYFVKNRITSYSTTTSLTIDCAAAEIFIHDNIEPAGTLTINDPTNTPIDGQKIIFRISSTNIQTFSWGSAFQGSTDMPLPTASTGGGKYDYIGFIYNSAATKWQMLSRNFGF